MSPDPNATPTTPAPAAGTSPPPTPAPSTPASTPAPSPASGPGSSGTVGAGTANPTPAVPTPAAPAASTVPADPWATVSPELRSQYEAAQRDAAQFRQYQHLIPLGYSAYQRQMQGQPAGTPPANQPPQPAKPANPFGLPEFDHNLLNFIRRDADGRLVMDPGAPPDAAIRVQQYQEQLQKVQREFWSDPGKFLAPMIEERAAEIARKTYEAQHQQVQGQQFVQQTLQQNAGWLYESQNGQPVTQFDPATGSHKPVLSPAGRLYAQHVQQAHSMGITNAQAQHQFAFAQVQAALLQAKLAQSGAPGAQAAANQQFIQGQTPVTQPGPTPTPAQPPQPLPTAATMRERMRQLMDGNGITDAVLNQQLTRGVHTAA